MEKYLYYGKYERDEARGLVEDRDPGRANMVKELFESVGGTVESFYLGAGEYDYFIIANVPGNAKAASASLKMCACGFMRNNMCALLTPEEINKQNTPNAVPEPWWRSHFGAWSQTAYARQRNGSEIRPDF